MLSVPGPHVLVRLVDELLWVLRREGFDISTAQAIDAVRAVVAVGLDRRADVRDALGAIVVQRAGDRDRFDAAFDRFFDGHTARERARTLWDRLSARGFDGAELDVLRALMDQLEARGDEGLLLGTFLERGADLDRALARWGAAREVDAHSGLQLGFLGHRLLSRMGAGSARRTLASLRALLAAALGARGERMADALAQELDQSETEVTAFLRRSYESSVAELDRSRRDRRLATTPFAALTDAEIEEVRRAVRSFAERLRGGARVRARRRALQGRVDAHRTLRRAPHTGGVPFRLVRRQRRRDRPRLVVLCDVSDSVRAAATFLLEFAYVVQELFSRTRSFVFVSDLGETTQLFVREPVRTAIALAWGGAVVRAGDNSNYGRVLRLFERQHGLELDRRTTVVILGDGRTNYHNAAADALDRIRERSRALLWLCPEPRGQWGQGDSAMTTYAAKCTAVYEVRCAADLERAARAIVARG
jgi:uncharacterized protein with von Willebrand factor type A (vWA) domain